jgi:hypothetical protein
MPGISSTQNFNNLVALFLAEAIRSRRTSLARAAEISRRVISRLGSMDSEDSALAMLTEIEKDFEEVTTLKQALHFGYQDTEIKTFEPEIKEFAARIFAQDLSLSGNFLQDAARPEMTIQELCIKYPKFCDFLYSSSDKAQLLPELQAAKN